MTDKDMTLAGNSTQILYDRIRQVLLDAQRSVSHVINTAMVHAYFEGGRLIVEDEQHGEARAAKLRSLRNLRAQVWKSNKTTT